MTVTSPIKDAIIHFLKSNVSNFHFLQPHALAVIAVARVGNVVAAAHETVNDCGVVVTLVVAINDVVSDTGIAVTQIVDDVALVIDVVH